jgi:hypothetical protein
MDKQRDPISEAPAKGSDSTPTQAMPKHGGKGAPDGVNSQAEGVTSDGSMEGGAYPNPHTGKKTKDKGGFARGFMGHGGQSEMGYHGTGQLGDQDVKPGGNVNSGDKDA